MTGFAYYLLKVIICSGVLFLYYHLALRNKLFHQWNRFYLLVAVMLSLLAPLVRIQILPLEQDTASEAIQLLQVVGSADGYLEEVTINGGGSISSAEWWTLAYVLVSAGFLVALILSLQKIVSIIHSHPSRPIDRIRFFNTAVPGTPFSFFHFIFWNDRIDLQTQTGQQIFQHEMVHVREKHTLDKLFMQVVLIVFWCNPFFWMMRRELRLIHEFIADKKAVAQQGAAALAAMILSSSFPMKFHSITNQFFQTSIKRRLAMLTKIQNPRINYISRIMALPMLAITIVAFSLRAGEKPGVYFPLSKPVIVVIDAAHGFSNDKSTGVQIDGVTEDEIVFSLANKIKELNNNDRVKILFTRQNTQLVQLKDRIEVARQNAADLFISLHVNAAVTDDPGSNSDQRKKEGIEIYVSNKNPVYQKKSEVLGSILQGELASLYSTNPHLLKRQNSIMVLDQNFCPAVVVELGYLTNTKDRAFITNEKNQTRLAEKILSSIQRYAKDLQESTGSATPQTTGFHLPGKSKDPTGKITLEADEIVFPSPDQSNTSPAPLIIINGKVVDASRLYGKKVIAQKTFAYGKNDHEAITSYGDRAKNGVVVFEEARIENNAENKAARDTVPSKYSQYSLEEVVVRGKKLTGATEDKTKQYDTVPGKRKESLKEVIVDGKKLGPDETYQSPISWQNARTSKLPVLLDGKFYNSMKDVTVDPSDIATISVVLGRPMVKEYGEVAAEGLIMIHTKNYQTKLAESPSDIIFVKLEKEPSIDRKTWIEFLQKSCMPIVQEAAKNGAKPGTYTVNVRFVVKKDGTISTIKALNDPGYGLAARVEELMKNSPKWNPGEQNGRQVHAYHTQPITFVITEE